MDDLQLQQEKQMATSSEEMTEPSDIEGIHTFSMEKFLKEFEEKKTTEDRIRLCLQFMHQSLEKKPRAFKDFWEVRKKSLILFKENIPSRVRVLLWEEHVDLTREARRLKDLLDEESNFACEQLELAIQSLEQDFQKLQDLLNQIPSISISQDCLTLNEHKEFYIQTQKELQLFQVFASKMLSLRKEVLKTSMRVRIKNLFFERLMKLGDQIFPRRKELIQRISETFLQNVEKFVKEHFESSETSLPFYVLKNEIQQLQAFAKQVPLNAAAFSQTREKLSQCWDQLKDREKEYKQGVVQKKQLYRTNMDLVTQKIQELSLKKAGEVLNAEQIEKEFVFILEYMKSLSLGRKEVKQLKDSLYEVKRELDHLLDAKHNQKKKAQQVQEDEKTEKIRALRKSIEDLLEANENISSEELAEKHKILSLETLQETTLPETEKFTFSNLLRQLQSVILDKKQKMILSDITNQEMLEKLYDLLDERKRQRLETKHHIEIYRKVVGGSSLDIGKSMFYQKLSTAEKSLLEKIDGSLIEIEEKIFDLESNS